MMDAFEMLQELLAQGQFELILPEAFETAKLMDKLRLVYLMNDAVESFLVFHQVKMTGSYQSDYEGELDASLQKMTGGEVHLNIVEVRKPELDAQLVAACCLGDFFSVFTLLLYYPQIFNSPSVIELPAFPLGRPANR